MISLFYYLKASLITKLFLFYKIKRKEPFEQLAKPLEQLVRPLEQLVKLLEQLIKLLEQPTKPLEQLNKPLVHLLTKFAYLLEPSDLQLNRHFLFKSFAGQQQLENKIENPSLL